MTSSGTSLRIGLVAKVLLAFGLVVLAALLAFSFLANQTAAREVRGFMFRGGMTDNALLAEVLADYFRVHGSWEGVGPLLSDPTPWHRMMGGMGPQPPGMTGGMLPDVSLSDTEGRVIAGAQPRGRVMPSSDLSVGTPILVDQQIVGVLVVSGPAVSTLGESLIGRVARGIWIIGAVTGLAAVLAGAMLVSGLLKPVRELTSASRALASGDLGRRVPVHSQDEVGELSAAFNQMAENLQNAEQLRRDMTADIAHELRNPLAVLQAHVEALADGVYPPTAEHLAPVLDQAKLLSRLVEDLRTLALADGGQLSLDRVPSNLKALAQRVVESYERQAADAGVRLRLDGEPALALVDPMRVEQILGNLISNALRHSGQAGEVFVRVGRGPGGERAVVSVTDQGDGIPEDALPRIFERFYRADRSRTRAEGGTGLGLAIARQLVEIQGGEIRVGNRPEGGAEFTISFPLAGEG
jgi:signal transduction histidine kinase